MVPSAFRAVLHKARENIIHGNGGDVYFSVQIIKSKHVNESIRECAAKLCFTSRWHDSLNSERDREIDEGEIYRIKWVHEGKNK